MSRKDYIAIAAAIKLALAMSEGQLAKSAVQRLARTIAEICKADNPNFNFERFYRACGVEK